MAQASAPALDAEDEEERSFKRDEQLAARDDEELEQQTPPDDDFLGSVARHRAQRQNKKPTTNLRATTRQPREGDEHEGDEATPIFQPTDELTPENEDYPPEGLRRRATRETPATHEQTGPKRPVTGPRVPDPLAGVENDEPDTELAARADELFDEPPLTDLAPRPVSSELIPCRRQKIPPRWPSQSTICWISIRWQPKQTRPKRMTRWSCASGARRRADGRFRRYRASTVR
jgi:hypothetical protein